jgi:chromosome segregation ATPase
MTTPGDESAQDMQALKRRYEELHKKKIRVETEKASSERRLRDLQRKARDLYGTDDLDELRARLDQMRAENERRRRDYQEHLDQIEARLQQVEAEHAAAREGVDV